MRWKMVEASLFHEANDFSLSIKYAGEDYTLESISCVLNYKKRRLSSRQGDFGIISCLHTMEYSQMHHWDLWILTFFISCVLKSWKLRFSSFPVTFLSLLISNQGISVAVFPGAAVRYRDPFPNTCVKNQKTASVFYSDLLLQSTHFISSCHLYKTWNKCSDMTEHTREV